MASNEARFTRRLSDSQRDAALKAVLTDGHSVKEAQRRAANGQLGVPAFQLTDTFYATARKHRAEYEARDETKRDLAIDDELARIVALALDNSRKLTAKSTPEDIARHAKTLATVKRAAREASTRPKAKPAPYTPSDTPTPEQPTASVITSLLDTLPETTRTGSLTDARIDPDPPRAA